MMAKGYNNSAIADNLVLGTKSVENYINAIFQKLHLGHNATFIPGFRRSCPGSGGPDLHPGRRLGDFPAAGGGGLSR